MSMSVSTATSAAASQRHFWCFIVSLQCSESLDSRCVFQHKTCSPAVKGISGCTLVKILSACLLPCAMLSAGDAHIEPVCDALLQRSLSARVMYLSCGDESPALALFAEVRSIYHAAATSPPRYITTPAYAMP